MTEVAAPAENPTTARIVILGDVMLGRLVNRKHSTRSPASFWGDTLPVIRAAEAVVVCPECATSDHGSKRRHDSKALHFRAQPTAIENLNAAGANFARGRMAE